MKIAQFGTEIVVLHAIAHGLHGLAHTQIPVPLSLPQSLFIGGVVFLIPTIAAVLLWASFDLIGGWLLFGSMIGAILFGIYNHFVVASPDHVSQVSLEGWGLLFQITAILTLVIDGLGCWIGLLALNLVRQPEQV